MPKFHTKWSRPDSFVLDCDQGDIVERAGYVPVKEQVERMRLAGLQLQAFRYEQFDGDDPEQLEIDPTRRMDKFEVTDYIRSADSYLYQKYQEAKKAKENDKKGKIVVDNPNPTPKEEPNV